MLVSSPDGSWCELYVGLTSVSVQSVLACGMSGFYEEWVGVSFSALKGKRKVLFRGVTNN
jgi:hypothetical protein